MKITNTQRGLEARAQRLANTGALVLIVGRRGSVVVPPQQFAVDAALRNIEKVSYESK